MEKYRLLQENKIVVTSGIGGNTPLDVQQQYLEEDGGVPVTTVHHQSRKQRHQNENVATATVTSQYPEVRITQQGKPRNYISYAMNLLHDGSGQQQQQQQQSNHHPTIVLKAMGRAINKAVTIAEILKRKINNLHQWNLLTCCKMMDIYEPIEEGLDIVENCRYVSCLTIVLSTTNVPCIPYHDDITNDKNEPVMLDVHHFGYQPPLLLVSSSSMLPTTSASIAPPTDDEYYYSTSSTKITSQQ